ncbi:MAG TPA: polysaccharide pyruvyl transferase family protein [Kiritimatiellia bacterium]|nr:polysaccharide pyruvyl transferase family protein [Kiritimatiellia bacterium]
MASGDEALYIAATRRLLTAGHNVTWLVRLPFEKTIKTANLSVKQIILPIHAEWFEQPLNNGDLSLQFKMNAPKQWSMLNRLIKSHDVVMVSPGGKFLDGYSIPRVLLTAAMAQLQNKPVIMLHQSVGPLSKETDIQLLCSVTKSCRLIVLRDDRSHAFASKHGWLDEHVVLSRDLIFAENYPLLSMADVPYDLGVNFRFGFNGHTTLEMIDAFFVDYRRLHPNHNVLWYSTTHELDHGAVAIADRHRIIIQPKVSAYPDYLSSPGKCSLNITDSFHGAIFSILADKPVIICQPDLDSHKFQGSSVPGRPTWNPMRGLIEKSDILLMLERIDAVRSNMHDCMELQRQLLDYGREHARTGWTAVENSLAGLQSG